jgi:hypothetical protein
MGAHTLPNKLSQAEFPTSGRDFHVESIGYLRAWGTTVPTDGEVGYATGCLFQHTDGTGETVFYVNQGTSSACAFRGFETALEADLALTTTGKGASKIGIEDSPGLFTSETVEAALSELRNRKATNITTVGSSETPTPVTLSQLKGGVILASGASAQYLELATPAAGDAGLVVTIIRLANASAVTISTAGTEQIAGLDTHATCDAIGDNITIVWTGTQWYITASNIAA